MKCAGKSVLRESDASSWSIGRTAVRVVQQQILSSIRDDFGHYRKPTGEDAVNEVLKLRAEACLDSLTAQFAKEYEKSQYSKVDV